MNNHRRRGCPQHGGLRAMPYHSSTFIRAVLCTGNRLIAHFYFVTGVRVIGVTCTGTAIFPPSGLPCISQLPAPALKLAFGAARIIVTVPYTLVTTMQFWLLSFASASITCARLLAMQPPVARAHIARRRVFIFPPVHSYNVCQLPRA